ncbi:hypothetical protein G7Y89_g6331 [Cudoniella acicularis]|uniref:Major facilitator superfamily (MFS) profile domain-containing protein n=1 Tax=Cudoniella acicularis TaxID=354080 RepID=A0A8H4W2Z0_9HELO|nr:hypothetical protein G7Y89_g6331 [Cudoniella acicularis]
MKASASSKRTSKLMHSSRRSNTAPDRLLSSPGISCRLDIAVLDETGKEWLSAWNSKFESLKISYSRSPMFFHPDPRDRDGLLEFTYRERRESELREIKGGSVSHEFSTDNISLPDHAIRKIETKRPAKIAVIGGGLSSAQVTATAVASGVDKVYHIVRGPLKVKHFDVGLNWVGKYKNFHLSSFWSADGDEERLRMLKEARGGGSITPEFKKILDCSTKNGRVELLEHTQVTRGERDENTQMWTLETKPHQEKLRVDHAVYATGLATYFASIPSLQSLLQTIPIQTVGGLPCLTEDLMWNDDIPLFFTGRLAGLRLGPAAGDLEGARQGTERIAVKFEELLKKFWGNHGFCGLNADDAVDMRRLGLGRENQFAVISTIPAQYFNKKRGIANGIVYAGGGLGGAAIAFALDKLIQSLGPEWAFRILGLVTAATGLPAAWLIKERAPITTAMFIEWRLFKNLHFTILFLAGAIATFPLFVPPFFLPLYATSLGLSQSAGAGLVAGFSFSSAVGRVGCGFLSDSIGPVNTLLFSLILSAISMLVIWPVSNSLGPLIVFVIVNGAANGGFFSTMPTVVGSVFGSRRVSVAMGMIVTGWGGGYLMGAPIAGYLLAAYGGENSTLKAYHPAIFYAGSMALASSALVLLLKLNLDKSPLKRL